GGVRARIRLALSHRPIRPALPFCAVIRLVQLPAGDDRWRGAISSGARWRRDALRFRAPHITRPGAVLDIGAMDDGAPWWIRRRFHVDDRPLRVGQRLPAVRIEMVYVGDDVASRDDPGENRGSSGWRVGAERFSDQTARPRWNAPQHPRRAPEGQAWHAGAAHGGAGARWNAGGTRRRRGRWHPQNRDAL